MEYPASTCPECESPMRPIKMIDATERSLGGGSIHVELTYAAEGATAGFLGGIPPEGKVRGAICPKCGRIVLYGTSL